MRVTDEVREHLAELELTLGEDHRWKRPPQVDRCLPRTWALARPPIAASVHSGGTSGRRRGDSSRSRCGIGAIRAGVLGLYRARPGPLTALQPGDALVFADTLTLLLDAHDEAAGGRKAENGRGGQAVGLACMVPKSTRRPGC